MWKSSDYKVRFWEFHRFDLPCLKQASFGAKALFGRRERRDTGSVDLSCMSMRGIVSGECVNRFTLCGTFKF